MSCPAVPPRHSQQRSPQRSHGKHKREQVPGAPCLQTPQNWAWGKGERASVSLLSRVLSLLLIHGKMEAEEGRESLSSQQGMLPAARWDAASPELLRGTQTRGLKPAAARQGDPRSIPRFKMQIPPLYFGWRGQGLHFLPPPRSPRRSFPLARQFCSGGAAAGPGSLCRPFSPVKGPGRPGAGNRLWGSARSAR